MIIFLDESFDNRHRYLLLGTLFVPTPGLEVRHLEAVKEQHRRPSRGHSFSDVKYSERGDRFYLKVCKDMVDLFAASNAYFCCIVIDTSMLGFSWSYLGDAGASPAIVKARAYSKFTALLLRPNLRGIENVVLLADSLSPCWETILFPSYLRVLERPRAPVSPFRGNPKSGTFRE